MSGFEERPYPIRSGTTTRKPAALRASIVTSKAFP